MRGAVGCGKIPGISRKNPGRSAPRARRCPPMYQPLADRIRPKTLDEVVGQRHILGENGLLRRVIESGKIPNMVFYGP